MAVDAGLAVAVAAGFAVGGTGAVVAVATGAVVAVATGAVVAVAAAGGTAVGSSLLPHAMIVTAETGRTNHAVRRNTLDKIPIFKTPESKDPLLVMRYVN